jgi:hypothetical protein
VDSLPCCCFQAIQENYEPLMVNVVSL